MFFAKLKYIYLTIILVCFLPFHSICCNLSSITLNSQTLNPDGSITYNLDFNIELGTLDLTFYGFTLSFLSSTNTPQVILGGTYNTTSSLSNANINNGFITGTLQGLTGNNINSVVQDGDWVPYQNMSNVLSFESNELFGAASNDISATIDVTVMGCVEQIMFDASVNSGSSQCEFYLSLNNNPHIVVSDHVNLCAGTTTELTIDTAYGGILAEEFDMTFNSAFSHTTTNTTLPGVYYVIVSGTFYGSTNETRDAFFGSGWYNNYTWSAGVVWKWNNVHPQNYAQIPTQLDLANHTYQMIFNGGSNYTFSFTDTQYGDNGGLLNFKIYYLGNISWSNGVTTYNNSVSPNNSTTYTATIDNGGCTDSDNVLVSVNTGGTSTDTISSCNNYTWINGVTYTTSNNSASITIPSSGGCDSVVNLDLTINYDSYQTDVQTSCNSYTWIDGITYTTSTNTPTFSITNQSGCDSIITLNLTINSSSATTDQITSCDNYTWIDGVTYTSSTNTPTLTLSSQNGCDSVISLDLSIYSSSNSTDLQNTCDSLSWINGQTYYASNNSAQFVTQNIFGCDSTINLDLTVYPSYFNYQFDTICSSELPYTWNGLTYNFGGNQMEILTSINNCDSITSYVLTVNNTPNVGINIGDTSICQDSSILIYGIGATTYSWSDNIIDSTFFTPTYNATYTVVGTDSNNCEDTHQVTITLDTCFTEPFTINIPNVFTPNNDGNNDGFYISGTSFIMNSTTIFNRWGEVVFKTNFSNAWDGRLSSGQIAPDGTYYYFIDINAYDNGIFTQKIYKGNLSLFR